MIRWYQTNEFSLDCDSRLGSDCRDSRHVFLLAKEYGSVHFSSSARNLWLALGRVHHAQFQFTIIG